MEGTAFATGPTPALVRNADGLRGQTQHVQTDQRGDDADPLVCGEVAREFAHIERCVLGNESQGFTSQFIDSEHGVPRVVPQLDDVVVDDDSHVLGLAVDDAARWSDAAVVVPDGRQGVAVQILISLTKMLEGRGIWCLTTRLALIVGGLMVDVAAEVPTTRSLTSRSITYGALKANAS